LVFVVNGDGTIALLNSRRESNVTAWTQWTTDGEFKAAAGLEDDIYFVVKRTINGVDYLFLEIADSAMRTDSSVLCTTANGLFDFDFGEIFGLRHLAGQSCRITIDGAPIDNVTPAVNGSATFTLPSYATADSVVRVGLNFNPTMTPMPVQTVLNTGSNFTRKRRLVNVAVRVRETLGLLLQINNQSVQVIPDRYYDVDSFDQVPTPFTGIHSREVTSNWDEAEDKLVTLTQIDPLPFEILGADFTVESHE